MANKVRLSQVRLGTVINFTSKQQEQALARAVIRIDAAVREKFPGITLAFEKQWLVKAVVQKLRREYPMVDFNFYHSTSRMNPDGGIMSVCRADGKLLPILIAEKKNQGTNDQRLREGKKKQAKGNAIERLGKNVIGFRAAMLDEAIFPFVCFGDGCDFAEDSSIIDRVTTIAMFGALNKEYLHNQEGKFNRGSFYFRESPWSEDEMYSIGLNIAVGSIYYYLSKYGEEQLLTLAGGMT